MPAPAPPSACAVLVPQDMTATVFHHLGINAREVLFPDGLARPTALVENGQPIRELVG